MPSPKNSSGINKNVLIAGTSLISITPAYLTKQADEDWPDLQPEHRAFVHEFILNGYKHRDAAKEVGLGVDGAFNLLRRPLIRAYISYVQNTMFSDSIVTKDFLDAKLDTLLDAAMGDVNISIVLADGEQVERKKFNGNLALGVIQEKAKLNGHSKTDTPKSGSITVNIDVGALLGKNAVIIDDETGKIDE